MTTNTISLSNNRGLVLVDGEDYEWLNQWKWCLVSGKYAGRAINHRNGNRRQRFVLMHRLIAGALDNEQVDHINNNMLDNRRSNLRCCTPYENSLNKPKPSHNKFASNPTSRYKGVHWRKARNRWEVLIMVNRKQIYVGRFKYDQEIEAARAYDKAALYYHGEFAHTNFGPYSGDDCPKGD